MMSDVAEASALTSAIDVDAEVATMEEEAQHAQQAGQAYAAKRQDAVQAAQEELLCSSEIIKCVDGGVFAVCCLGDSCGWHLYHAVARLIVLRTILHMLSSRRCHDGHHHVHVQAGQLGATGPVWRMG